MFTYFSFYFCFGQKRRSVDKTVSADDNNMCAIDLLATVAGHLSFESGSSLMSVDKLIEDHRVKKEVPEEEKPLMPVAFSEENPYQGSLSPCGFSSVINGKLEDDAEGFSYSGATDSCQVSNFSQDIKPVIDGDAVVSVGSTSRTQVPSIGNCASHGLRDDVNLFSRDDDENFSGYVRPRGTKNSPRSVPRIGDRRIRKILASRHWKGSSRHTDTKPWRNYYLQNQRSYPIKKRKYYDHISDSITDDYRLRTKMHRGSRTVSSMKGQGASFVSSNSHVKLRIKSFRVPELFIEIPESATVGSLKRMVMEAVSTLLSDGHRVGLMVQGKKVRDDNKTLHQTGISQDNNHLDSLDFSLEPSSEMPQLLTSHPLEHAYKEMLPVCEAATTLDNVLESDHHDSALFPSDSLGNNNMTEDSKAMVPMALTDLSPSGTLCRKSKRSEQQQQQAAQRRIRRPFSVSEVEALVQAVEKLGTGRWRDVKLRAFEDADHRTYVDLKDKWKTLVHTAKISPQQRRGEPVPQELLNRVLNAHGYWTQHQLQLQQNVNKQQQETPSQTEALLLH
ncbi:hypothetical protein CARUB_v10026172mg [Capsella rubella]|uniref:HTH myb-type domain-containing protein n=1 Tax=Capsella rubella TaxID=81985 RepID=R0G9B9_9BRAS|nr:hypothetical protein CARUB_v10026172mg [Capsella rubella]